MVVYLGFSVSREGMSPEVETVRDFPPPRYVKSLRSFLGLASYYCKFVLEFSIIANPLFTLTMKDVEFDWCTQRDETFQES